MPFLFTYNKAEFEMFLQMPKLVSPVHVSYPPGYQTASMGMGAGTHHLS